jgi:hypothetical protein
LADKGIYAGTLTIGGLIERGDIHRLFSSQSDKLGDLTVQTLSPDTIADTASNLYSKRDSPEAIFNALT